MLYPHPLPSAEESSFLAILHHFKKVLKFQLLLHETRNEKKKKLQLLLSFLQISLFFWMGEGIWSIFRISFTISFFFYHLSLTLGFVCLECTIVCVAAANTAPPPPFSFSLFLFSEPEPKLVSGFDSSRIAPCACGRRAIPNISSFVATLAARSGVSLVALGRVVYLLLRTSVRLRQRRFYTIRAILYRVNTSSGF